MTGGICILYVDGDADPQVRKALPQGLPDCRASILLQKVRD
mgnify:CR=1 FL=1